MSELALLAMVTGFGGHGGIAQYDRDLLSSLADAKPKDVKIRSIAVLPRHAQAPIRFPSGIRQMHPQAGRLAYTLKALAIALSQRVDVVFCGHLYMAPLAALIAKLKGARLIVQAHGIEAWQRPARLQRAALEAADLVLCVSRYTRERILDWAAIPPERVFVLPNTVRNIFTPGDGEALRRTLGLEGKRVLLTVGRMDSRERYKGHDLVLAAIPRLLTKGYDIAYVVVGEGNDRMRIEDLAHDMGISERVHFLGAVEPQFLIEAYRMADLFVMPSSGEGFGIAFLEAMASGTPAVGLAKAGALDALADGELGTLTSESDFASAIADQLSRAPGDPLALAEAVWTRFGPERFKANASLALERLMGLT
jgi:phosphatidylinositol alpha-1,6-mannosyltransferase